MTLQPTNQSSSTSKRYGSDHPINIRVSFPIVRRRYFLTIIGGSEHRSPERRLAEREINPLKTTSNIIFITGFAVIFYVLAFTAIAIQSSIIEF